MTPMEMNAFVDSFKSEHVRVHFDTGNISMFQFAEHWVPILGKRIKNIHFKEFTKKGTDYSLETFRPLLDGTTNWPAVMDALDKVGYRGYVTFEYFHPVSALSRGADLPDERFAGPHAGGANLAPTRTESSPPAPTNHSGHACPEDTLLPACGPSPSGQTCPIC